MNLTAQYLRFCIAIFISIISCILFSASIESRSDNISLKIGVWQSTQNSELLLNVTNNHFSFYHLGPNNCVLLEKQYQIKNVNTVINNVHFNKEFRDGWLLSPTPPTPILAITTPKANTLKTITFRQVSKLPSPCLLEQNSH